jgi:hypothetical protein
MQTEIHITNDDTLKDIQASFFDVYPFLMFEFHQKNFTGSAEKPKKIAPDTSIKELVNLPAPYRLDINSDRSVILLLADFKTDLGLSVVMYRKSGNVWNAISITDEWTLQAQNSAGEYICSLMEAPDMGSTSANSIS